MSNQQCLSTEGNTKYVWPGLIFPLSTTALLRERTFALRQHLTPIPRLTLVQQKSKKASDPLCVVDGSAFEPSQTASDAQYVFDPLWCRSVEFVDQGNESVSNLTVHRYTLSSDVFNNSLYARGFCTGGKCLPPGVMNATACQGQTFATVTCTGS